MNPRTHRSRRRLGALQADLVTALGLAALVVIPFGYGFLNHQRLIRNETVHATLLGLLDGELEILAAGEHRAFPTGTSSYPLHGLATQSLPPGTCTLTRETSPEQTPQITLEWKPTATNSLHVVRLTRVIPALP